MTEAPALTPRRLRKRERSREAIKLAGRSVFESQGYSRTTLQDLARAADVTHATFYAYFKSKDALFGELVDEVIEQFMAVGARLPIDAAGTPGAPTFRERLSSGFGQILEVAATNGALLRAIRQAIHASELHAERWSALRTRFSEPIEQSIDWYVAHGILAPPAERRVLVRTLTAMVEHAILDLATDADLDVASVRDVLVDVAWNVLCRPREGADDYVIGPRGRVQAVFVKRPRPRR